jgi:hypothetical protein
MIIQILGILYEIVREILTVDGSFLEYYVDLIELMGLKSD